MKRLKLLVIISIFITILLTGCGKTGYEEISYEDLTKKLNNNETFALFIGRETCTSCTTFKEILNDLYAKEYAKEATIYYIDTDKLSDEEYANFHTQFYYTGTPTVTILVDGKFTPNNSVTGSDKYNDMIDMMKNKGLLKG